MKNFTFYQSPLLVDKDLMHLVESQVCIFASHFLIVTNATTSESKHSIPLSGKVAASKS